MEDIREFALLVVRLREAQQKFFTTRAHYFLYESKRLEKLVDQKADEIINGKQPELELKNK